MVLPKFADKVQWVMALPKLIGKVSVDVRHCLEHSGVDGIGRLIGIIVSRWRLLGVIRIFQTRRRGRRSADEEAEEGVEEKTERRRKTYSYRPQLTGDVAQSTDGTFSAVFFSFGSSEL